MRKLCALFFSFVTLFAVNPAFASMHNGIESQNWVDRIMLFGLPLAASVILFVWQRQRMAVATFLVGFVLPIVWGVARVVFMGGPWELAHWAGHHAEIGYLCQFFLLVPLVSLLREVGHLPQRTAA